MKVEKSTEEHEIPEKSEMMSLAETVKDKAPDEKANIKDLIKCFWAHTLKAHEEVSAAASILQILADEVDEVTYMSLVNAGTRPLIMVEVPQMAKQATEMRLEREQQERTEDMCGQLIVAIIAEQNVPQPVEQWVNSSILLPT